ncbi:L-rhamnose mutarotase [Massilia aurea]|uniref:L-rhamnose mutarotase n=1 Tax=Massilia aurea TaxID=373040 RepID=UPI0034618C46
MAGLTRRAFRMKLKAGNEAEYQRRHDAIWPDLAALLRAAGIVDYAIFLDAGTLDLFAVMTLAPQADPGPLPEHPVMRRWWDFMADLMEVEPGNRPKEWPLVQVFELE